MTTQGNSKGKSAVLCVSCVAGFVRRVAMQLAFVFLVFASFVAVPYGAQAAMVTVVHGINGNDLGAAASLPVDIAVNGNCAIKALPFAQLTRVELAAGTYAITVHPTNGSCSLASLIRQSVTVPASARSIGLVANLSDSGAPQLAAFINDDDFAPSVRVNNAAANAPIFAGAGPARFVTYYAKPLVNGSGVMVLGSQPGRRILVKFYRENFRTLFFNARVRLTKSGVYYVVGSKKSGLRVVIDS